MSRRTAILIGVVILLLAVVMLLRMNTANVAQDAQIQLDNRQLTLESAP